jgi:YihY family inner membrane protein
MGKRTGLALLLVLSGALVVGAVIAGLGVVSRALADAPSGVQTVAGVLVWVGLALLMAVGLAVLYRVAPDRTRARWHWISWGAATATVLWVLVSLALFAYVSRLGTYESTYGSLAGVAISMLWLWLTVLLVLLGGRPERRARAADDRRLDGGTAPAGRTAGRGRRRQRPALPRRADLSGALVRSPAWRW